MRRSTLVLALAACFAFACAQKTAVNKPKAVPPVQNWQPTKMTFAAVAQKVAQATSSLKATVADLNVYVKTPEGQGMFLPRQPGKADGITLQVKDNKHYRVDYVAIQNIPFSCTLVNNGVKRGVRANTDIKWYGASYRLPLAKTKGDALVELFEFDFSRLAFQGLTDGADAWKDIIGGWTRGANGYKATIEERRMRAQGHDFLSYRIRANRTAQAAKKRGASSVEVVIDGHWFLPVTIRVDRTDEKGKKWTAQWEASYRFKQMIHPDAMLLGGGAPAAARPSKAGRTSR